MPSDNKYNKTKRSADYLSYKDKVIKDALSRSKYRPKPLDSTEALMQKAMDVTAALRNQIKPILQAGGATTDTNRTALRETVMTMYLQAFDSFTKEELTSINAVLHTEIFMESVEADVWGKDKPDLMSGV